jgi:hypothetical protein
MYVDGNAFGANTLLTMAAYSNVVRGILKHGIGWGTSIARRFGSEIGGVAYELEGEDGRMGRFALVAKEKSYLVAIAPAILAIQRIANDQFTERGLVLPDRYVDAVNILAYLKSAGVQFVC